MLQDCRLVFVCAGLEVKAHADKETLNLIRRLIGKGYYRGNLHRHLSDGCSWPVDDRRCTIHWENIDGLAEEFPYWKSLMSYLKSMING